MYQKWKSAAFGDIMSLFLKKKLIKNKKKNKRNIYFLLYIYVLMKIQQLGIRGKCYKFIENLTLSRGVLDLCI